MGKSRRTCGQCGRFMPLARTGRPKVYCNVRCRVAAFRLREREAGHPHPPATLHEALGTEPANGSRPG